MMAWPRIHEGGKTPYRHPIFKTLSGHVAGRFWAFLGAGGEKGVPDPLVFIFREVP